MYLGTGQTELNVAERERERERKRETIE